MGRPGISAVRVPPPRGYIVGSTTPLPLESVSYGWWVPGVPPSGRRRSARRPSYSSGGLSAGGLTDQVVALGDVRRAPGGLDVRRRGSGQVSVELVQVAADGMPAVAVAEHPAQRVGLEQSRGRTARVADRDGAAEHAGGVLAHRVVGERHEG